MSSGLIGPVRPRVTVAEVIEREDLEQVSGEEDLQAWVSAVFLEHPKAVADRATDFLVGQAMKKSRGKANPGRVKDLITQALTSEG